MNPKDVRMVAGAWLLYHTDDTREHPCDPQNIDPHITCDTCRVAYKLWKATEEAYRV